MVVLAEDDTATISEEPYRVAIAGFGVSNQAAEAAAKETVKLVEEQRLADTVDKTYPVAVLAALVPKPRVNLTRFHGVFAPNSKHRAWVTPAKRGKGGQKVAADQDEKTLAQRHVAMTWAQRLKRVFTNSRRLEATLMWRPAASAVAPRR
jgi:hypothetical protein